MSLKRITLLLVGCLTLSACNVANVVRMRFANDDLTPVWTAKTTRIELPSVYDGEKPYVFVSINGIDNFKFMVDTGASMSYLIDTPKVKALNVERGYEFSIGGWGDEEDSVSFQTEVATLALGETNFANVNLAFLPATKSKYFLRPDEATFDGVLGHDLMRHFSWSFDKQGNKITISNQAYEPIGVEKSADFTVSFKKINVQGEIDFGESGVTQQRITIDTGSRHYLKVNENYVNSNDVVLPGTVIMAADFGLSGRVVHRRATLPAVRFGDIEINNVKANVVGKWEDEDDYWIVGSALLNQFISVIDYHSGKLHLISYPDTTFRTRYNLLGLSLRKLTSGEFIVRFVFPELPSSTADIQEGDVVTRINGIAAADISKDQWLAMTATPGHYQICRVRDTEQCLDVQSSHIAGYSIPAK